MHVDGDIKSVFNDLGPMIVIKQICMDEWRPNVDKIMKGCQMPEIANIIKACWAQDPEDRPSMTSIVEMLSDLASKYQ